MSEPSMLQEGTFQITRRRVVADGAQYMFDTTHSVQIGTQRIPPLIAIPGILFALGSLMVPQLNGSLIFLAVGVIAFAALGYLWWRASRTYILILGTTDGDRQILTTNDRKFLERAAQTIDALIVEKSRR